MTKGSKLKEAASLEGDERNRSMAQLAASMRLNAIGQIKAGVAHELNNPLSVILGYAQSLLKQYGTDATLQPSMKTIERETLRCKHLVQDLLNFSRLPRPGKVMEDIVQVLEGALSLVEALTRIHHIDLIRELSANLPMVFVDRHRIQQMVMNLCINAVDAMPKGGQLKVGASLVSGPKELPVVQIRISDTGTGIAPEIRDRIFEPFFTTKDLGKGTGLGLSLVRDIVKEHQGRIEFLSELSRGTTFIIRIPASNRLETLDS